MALSEKIAVLLHRNVDVPCSLVVTYYTDFGRQIVSQCLCLTSPSLALADEPGTHHDVRAH